MLRTPSVAAILALVLASGSTYAATYTWTGGAGAGSNWYDAGNWSGGLVPNTSDGGSPTNTSYSVNSLGAIVVFDSETASGGLMPTATLSNSNDWFPPGWNLSPATYVKNGTINYGNLNAAWWMAGDNAIDLEVGDGDLTTAASVNLGWSQINRYLNTSTNGVVIKVNADGTVNQATNLAYANYNYLVKIALNGGDYNVNGTVTGLSTGTYQAQYTVSFDALGSAFTAKFGADFVDLAAVNAQLGSSFVDNTGNGLVATDNFNGTFTVSLVVPEPASVALLGVGGFMLFPRRRR